MWDNEITTEQGRRSLIAAFILTLVLAAPLVFLTGQDLTEPNDTAVLSDQLAEQLKR